ncbi:MAG: c-type cytochrome [Alphaproteobacteria bacterium]|nr:c-type cytochrome [Alphaproteobacteria bacterium]
MTSSSPTALAAAAVVLCCVAVIGSGLHGAEKPGAGQPGGTATYTGPISGNAFSKSSASLPFEKELDFKVGNGLFKKLWVPAPSSTKSSDGLGPFYNARSCQRCHLKDGRGHPPSANFPADNAVSLLIRLGIPSGDRGAKPDPVYGGQLQDFAMANIPIEGRPHVTWREETVALSDGSRVSLRRPTWTIADLGYGPLHADTRISPRIAPPMIGLGLLEAVPAEQILERADPDDRDGDGISGVAAQVIDVAVGRRVLGRFGWKASQPSLRQQAAGAFLGDIGLSTSLFPDGRGDCTERQGLCRTAPIGADPGAPEISDTMLDLVSFYSRHLAVPARRNAEDDEVRRGEQVFADSGCTACHRPSLSTASAGVDPALADQTIWPFTDLLLHDMGDGLADGLPEGMANGREWRTPPLWGIGLTERVSGHTYFLHDGRARSILEAILWHGGEGRAARDRVVALPGPDREALLAYINSL